MHSKDIEETNKGYVNTIFNIALLSVKIRDSTDVEDTNKEVEDTTFSRASIRVQINDS